MYVAHKSILQRNVTVLNAVRILETTIGIAQMKQTKILATMLFSGFLALLISGNVAADWTWTFPTGGYERSITATKGSGTSGGGMPAPNLTVTGWANSGVNDTLKKGWLYSYGGGLGVTYEAHQVGAFGDQTSGQVYESLNSPQHSTDNYDRIDSILLDFGTKAVTLDEVRFSWIGGINGDAADGDFTLAAYSKSGDPKDDFNNQTYGDLALAGSGWDYIQNYQNSNGSENVDTNPDVSSSYWLISALNPELSGASNDGRYDFFKLRKVIGSKPIGPPSQSIPEPSTLLLLGSALLMVAMRRRYLQNRGACTIQA